MKKLKISDITMKQKRVASLTFREKLKLIELLDTLHVDAIEVAPLSGNRADSLCAKSFAQSLQNTVLAIPAGLNEEEINRAWDAIGEAAFPRLQIVCPVSSVQMEYLYHVKPATMQNQIVSAIAYAKTLCNDVEFIACDATRSEKTYLFSVLDAAIQAGASKVTVSDDAGNMMPEEYRAFVEEMTEKTAGLKNGSAELAIHCCNQLSMADICSVNGAMAGASEIKASVFPDDSASVSNIHKIIRAKGDSLGLELGIHTVALQQIVDQVERLFTQTKSQNSPFENNIPSDREANTFTASDGIEVIIKEIARLGYDLTDDDNKTVYDTFLQIATKKEHGSGKELEAIIASSAMQVPPTYKLEDFIINSGNTIAATCHVRLRKNGELVESVAIGDGPVDASFLAIERITGHHYELDDFQIQSVTEGRTAMGETIVKLRAEGKLYSGRGISTDVIGSSIYAYINALNKIAYEEENA